MELNAKIPSGPIDQHWTNHQFDMKLVNPANKRKYKVIVVGSGLYILNRERKLKGEG